MSANRPASASAMPCLKDSRIHESSFSTTNLVTFARSLAGRALNCSIISAALIGEINNRMLKEQTESSLHGARDRRKASHLPEP